MIISNSDANANPFFKGQVQINDQASATQTAQAEKLESQQASLAAVLAGEADIVEISDEARALSAAAQAEAEQAETTTTNAADSVAFNSATATQDAAQSLYGKEAREDATDYYNSVLENLRSNYSEEEAMRKFDDFMRSEGFELQAVDSSTYNGALSASGRVNDPRTAGLSGYSMGTHTWFEGVDKTLGDSRITAHSTIGMAEINGETKYYAESTFAYYAYNSDEVYSTLSGWKNAYADSFAEQASFDAGDYREAIGASEYRALVAADRDLGSAISSVVSSSLAAGGHEFGSGDNVGFTFSKDENGNITGVDAWLDLENYEQYMTNHDENGLTDYDRMREKLNADVAAALKKDPSLLAGFVAMDEANAKADPASLAGAYSDGDRGVSYSTNRSFVLSGTQPDTMVMTENLYVNQTGYTYVKTTDAFDPTANTMMVSGPNYWPDQHDPDAERLYQQMRDDIAQAIANGDVIEGEVDHETYRENRAGPGLPGMYDPNNPPPEVGIYDARTGERIDNNPDWKPVEEEAAEEVPEESTEEKPEEQTAVSTSVEYKNQVRESALRDILSRAEASGTTRESDMLTQFMDQLREFYENRDEKAAAQ